MGVCTSSSFDQKRVISAFQRPLKLDKKRKELSNSTEMNRSKLSRKLIALSEDALLKPLSITIVNLSRSHLGPSGVHHLSKVLPFCVNLTVLKLLKCKIGSTATELLSDALSALPHLQVLSLEENDLGFNGAEHISKCFPHLLDLRELYLLGNDLRSEGVRVLAESLGCLENLTVLTLDENDITSNGVYSLLDNVQLWKLELLGLAYNNITDSGVQHFIKCAGNLPKLQIVQFTGNLVSMLVAEQMLRAFPHVKIL